MGCLDLFWVFIKINFLSAGVAQLVERNLAKVEVASSRLVSRSRYKRRETLSSFPFFVCGPRMTELVDVADLKASKSGSMKSDKNLDFSRLERVIFRNRRLL